MLLFFGINNYTNIISTIRQQGLPTHILADGVVSMSINICVCVLFLFLLMVFWLFVHAVLLVVGHAVLSLSLLV